MFDTFKIKRILLMFKEIFQISNQKMKYLDEWKTQFTKINQKKSSKLAWSMKNFQDHYKQRYQLGWE